MSKRKLEKGKKREKIVLKEKENSNTSELLDIPLKSAPRSLDNSWSCSLSRFCKHWMMTACFSHWSRKIRSRSVGKVSPSSVSPAPMTPAKGPTTSDLPANSLPGSWAEHERNQSAWRKKEEKKRKKRKKESWPQIQMSSSLTIVDAWRVPVWKKTVHRKEPWKMSQSERMRE